MVLAQVFTDCLQPPCMTVAEAISFAAFFGGVLVIGFAIVALLIRYTDALPSAVYPNSPNTSPPS